MSMTRKEVKATMQLAKDFIEASEALLARIDYEKGGYGYRNDKVWKPEPQDRSWSSPESGTLRRRSMDLTRALANLRKP